MLLSFYPYLLDNPYLQDNYCLQDNDNYPLSNLILNQRREWVWLKLYFSYGKEFLHYKYKS